MKNFIKFIVLSLFFTISCSFPNSSDETEYMSFDNVEYVSKFPKEFTLNAIGKPIVKDVGLREIRVINELLIAEIKGSESLWDIYKLPEYILLGSFLKKGDGPLELMQGADLNKTNFEIKNGHLIAYIYDFQKGRVMQFNISESLSSGKEVLTEYATNLPSFSFAFAKIDTLTFLVKELVNRDTQQVRYLINNGIKEVFEVAEKLNESSIKQGEDFNILSALTGYNMANGRIVEAPIGLNNINIYSKDGSFSKTICLEEKMSDINKVQSQFKWNRMYTIANLRLYDTFFGIVFINEDEKSYQTVRRKFPTILFFDYEGKPLSKLETGTHFTSFDIDFANQKMYTFDFHSDEFMMYDLRTVLPIF